MCKPRHEQSSHCSFRGTRHREVFKAKLVKIKLALDIASESRDAFQMHGVKMVAVSCDSQAAIQ